MDRRQRSRNILEAIQSPVTVVEGLDQESGKHGSLNLQKALEISLFSGICKSFWILYVGYTMFDILLELRCRLLTSLLLVMVWTSISC